jgi:hypothetical protein
LVWPYATAVITKGSHNRPCSAWKIHPDLQRFG